MLRNYFLVNIILIVIIGLLGVRLYSKIVYTAEIPSVPSAEEDKNKVTLPKSAPEAANDATFRVISDMNIFSPDRKPHKAPDAGKTDKPVPGKLPKLFGTIITDTSKSAIVEDAVTNTTRMYAINDSVSGYVISDILNDRIIVLSDGNKIEIKLREDKGIQPSVKTPPVLQPLTLPRAERNVPVQRQRPRRIPRQVIPETDMQQEETAPPVETADESVQEHEATEKPEGQ